jgi:hypothetical protein
MSQGAEQGMPNPRGRKSVPWRRDPTILARLPLVERLHLAGRPNVAIAAELGLDETTIRRDLERIGELWKERAGGDIAEQRARIIAELDDTRRRALEFAEWDQACEAAVLFGAGPETVPTREDTTSASSPESAPDDAPEQDAPASESPKPEPRKTSVLRDHRGSAQFRGQKAASLGVARQATMDKAKLLGLVVDKVAPTNAAGEDIPLDELMARFARAQQPASEPSTETDGNA